MPSPDRIKFSAWFTAEERTALERVASAQDRSVNFVLRSLVRMMMDGEIRELTEVTIVTRNGDGDAKATP